MRAEGKVAALGLARLGAAHGDRGGPSRDLAFSRRRGFPREGGDIVVPEPMAPALRRQHQGKGGIPRHIDRIEGIHLNGNTQGHGNSG